MTLTDTRTIVAGDPVGDPLDLADELRRLLTANPAADLSSLRLVEEQTPGLWRWYARLGTITDPYAERPECSSCHQPTGRPHTEYCETVRGRRCRQDGGVLCSSGINCECKQPGESDRTDRTP